MSTFVAGGNLEANAPTIKHKITYLEHFFRLRSSCSAAETGAAVHRRYPLLGRCLLHWRKPPAPQNRWLSGRPLLSLAAKGLLPQKGKKLHPTHYPAPAERLEESEMLTRLRLERREIEPMWIRVALLLFRREMRQQELLR